MVAAPARHSASSPPVLAYLVTEAGFFSGHWTDLARAAQKAGYAVHVITSPATAEEARRITAQGFILHPLHFNRKSMNPFGQLLVLLRIILLYRKLCPAIVHHVAVKPVLYGSIAARLAGISCVVNAIVGLGFVFVEHGAGLGRRVLRWCIERAYAFCLQLPGVFTIFQNPDDRDFFISRGLAVPEQTVLIKGVGVDTRRFTPGPELQGPPVIVLGARMLWHKGVGEFVEGVRLLRQEGLVFTALLAGTPDPHNPASIPEQTLQKWHEEKLICWKGQVGDMAGLLGSAHIACLPSYREGLPLFLLEAAACALPLVTTDTPGCREVVRHDYNGLLVPANDVETLAHALKTLIEDPGLRQRMGQAGRKRAEQEFSTQQVNEATLDLYRTLQDHRV